MAKQVHRSTTQPTNESVERYEMLSRLLESVFSEVKALSVKKPDESLNKFKVQSLNRLLKELKELLAGQPTIGFLDLIDEESIPSNSDGVLILSQYSAALELFHDSYYGYDGTKHRWHTQENP